VAQRTFADEADHCRWLSDQLNGQAEKRILYRIASEFDRLAELRGLDSSYYAWRASQEVSAAVKARHPAARLAHLIMARRYDALVKETQQH
jgi:hypothetical protein